MKRLLLATVALAALTIQAGCVPEETSAAARDTRATLQATEQGALTVGFPAVINWAEKRQLKIIYELRDTLKLMTYTYVTDLQGKLHNACPGSNSIGFPIPYATQFTAPKAAVARHPIYSDGSERSTEYRIFEADQPEPNGLFMPSSAEGTWVVCLNPETKELAPTYIEDRVRTYLYRVPSID